MALIVAHLLQAQDRAIIAQVLRLHAQAIRVAAIVRVRRPHRQDRVHDRATAAQVRLQVDRVVAQAIALVHLHHLAAHDQAIAARAVVAIQAAVLAHRHQDRIHLAAVALVHHLVVQDRAIVVQVRLRVDQVVAQAVVRVHLHHLVAHDQAIAVRVQAVVATQVAVQARLQADQVRDHPALLEEDNRL